MSKNIYITTPIYYASGNPHLGHAYSTFLADCFAKYYKIRGDQVQFTTGMDEHGLKIERIAQQNKQDPQKMVDELANVFQDTWSSLGITYSDFIRTTEKRHKKVAQNFWGKMDQNGDIYLGKYEGLYCVDCEEYYQEGELDEENNCPIHHRKVEKISEDSYFFKLSKYQEKLMEHIRQNPEFIMPKTRRNEVLGFLKSQKLLDLSISRTTFSWGIPVPNNPKHVMYVWVDALVNYISSLDGLDAKKFDVFWKNTYHIIGKDILRFHAIYWPCMLMSANIELPKSIIVHGWWTIQNKKISKSLPATKIDPTIFIEDLGQDGIRFFLLKSLSLGLDGDLSFENLIKTVNVHLINNIANLLNRFSNMADKFLDGNIAAPKTNKLGPLEVEIIKTAQNTLNEIERRMSQFNPSFAIQSLLDFSTLLNTYLEKTAPWALSKNPKNQNRINEIFAYIAESLAWIANLGYPFFPNLSKKILTDLNIKTSATWPKKFELKNYQVSKSDIYLQRITSDHEKSLIKKWSSK